MVEKIIGKIFGDKKERDDAKARIRELELRGQLEPLLKQIEVNVEEAKHSSVFVAGWRPAAAWLCVGALGLGFIVQVIVPAVIVLVPALFGAQAISDAWLKTIDQLKQIDLGIYVTMLMGMLGLGTMRAYEKSHGIQDSKFSTIKTVTADDFLRHYTKRFGGVTKTHINIVKQIFDKLEEERSEDE
jgi:hypothetical protein